MRQVPVLMGALMLALVASLALLWYRPSLWPDVAVKIGASPPQAPPASGRESPFTTPERKNTAGAKLWSPSPSDTPQQPEPAPLRSPVSAPVEFRFPSRADVSMGALKPAILAAFGPPHASVAGADRGQLQERLIYTERSTGKKTIIDLVNGKVTSADTFVAGTETRK